MQFIVSIIELKDLQVDSGNDGLDISVKIDYGRNEFETKTVAGAKYNCAFNQNFRMRYKQNIHALYLSVLSKRIFYKSTVGKCAVSFPDISKGDKVDLYANLNDEPFCGSERFVGQIHILIQPILVNEEGALYFKEPLMAGNMSSSALRAGLHESSAKINQNALYRKVEDDNNCPDSGRQSGGNVTVPSDAHLSSQTPQNYTPDSSLPPPSYYPPAPYHQSSAYPPSSQYPPQYSQYPPAYPATYQQPPYQNTSYYPGGAPPPPPPNYSNYPPPYGQTYQ